MRQYNSRQSASLTMALSAGTRIGAYEVLGLIGAGGMGEVYRARDGKLRRDVAIKVLPNAFARNPERLARFRREAQVLATLNHPHIAAIYGVEETGGLDALVLELVEGPTLADRIAKGPLPIDDALKIAAQLADALDAAHEKGIVHRDLKPANIKITLDDRVKVLDFGLAKALADDSSLDASASPTMTAMASRLGVIVGTAAYMSPEQAKGKAVDKRTDIWAFGCVLYEMLTGTRAFAGDDVTDFIVSVMTKEPDWTALPAATPPRVVELLKRCLKKDPRERLRDIGDARSHLEEAAPSAMDGKRRSTVAWIGAFAVGIAVGVAVAIAIGSTSRAPEPARSPIRFEMPTGQLPTSTGQPMVAVSPNGRYLAYVAPREGVAGETVLWIRAFDAEDARPIEKTSNATFPFWSPDSRTVGFFAANALNTVDVGGGSIQTLGRVPGFVTGAAGDTRGAAWSPDGRTIVVGSTLGLFTIPAGGSQMTPLTTVSGDETSQQFPAFLPDGRHIIYTSFPSNSAWVVSLETKKAMQLLTAATQAQYDGAGRLLFVRQGTLMAQPFNGESSTSGEAVPIARVLRDNNSFGFAFSISSNGTLVYRPAGDAPNAQLTWVDRRGRRADIPGATGKFRNPALSPDGGRAAVEVFDPTTLKQDIWTIDLGRGVSSRFTFDPANEIFPVWSPDGKWIVFASDRSGVLNLYRKPADGTGTEELLLKSPVEMLPTSFTQDGSALVYRMRKTDSGGLRIGILTLGGTPTAKLFSDEPFALAQGYVSQGDRFLAYNSTETGRFEIYVQSFPKPGAGKWQVSNEGGGHLRWPATGKEIFFYSFRGQLMAAPVTSTQPFAVGAPVPLFEMRMLSGPVPIIGYRAQFDVAKDGRFLVNVPVGDETPPISVVLNWAAGLKR